MMAPGSDARPFFNSIETVVSEILCLRFGTLKYFPKFVVERDFPLLRDLLPPGSREFRTSEVLFFVGFLPPPSVIPPVGLVSP